MIEHIYALHAGDVIFYTGRSNDLKRRYGEHIRSADPEGTLKERVIHQLLQDGHKIELRILESGTAEQLQGKEDEYIINLRAEGHPLTNDRAGDSPLLIFEPSGEPVIPWSVELFENADWKKDDPKAKSGEWCAWIKGVQFFRVGKSKLRMWHPEFGEWQLGRINSDAYANTCAKLTPGTEQNKKFLEQVAQVRRHRG